MTRVNAVLAEVVHWKDLFQELEDDAQMEKIEQELRNILER
jgi:hypothetical protein